MTRLRSRVRSRLGVGDERGTSLVEMVVTVALLGMIMAFVIQAFTSYWTNATGADLRLQNLDEARLLMGVTSRDVRTASALSSSGSPFYLANDMEITFYGYLDAATAFGPNLVHIYVDGSNRLIEEVTPPDASSIPPAYTYTGTAVVRLVGRYIGNVAGTDPIFKYYDDQGTQLVAPLTAQDQLKVRSIGITFSVRKAVIGPLPTTTLVNRVTLPNIYFNPGT